VLAGQPPGPALTRVETLRKELRQDRSVIRVDDHGAGPAGGIRDRRRIGELVRSAAQPNKRARFLFRLAQHYQPQAMLELGTSLGLSAACLALGSPSGRLISLEGSAPIAALARTQMRRLSISNVDILTGTFDEQLNPLLENNALYSSGIDLVFLDGNHRYEPTLRYFSLLTDHMAPSSVILLDDIRWSREMEMAWKIICRDPRVLLTIDLFFLGLVFFRPEFRSKQHFRFRF